MTDLERALLHIKTRADAWALKEVEKALSQESIDEWQNGYDAVCEIINDIRDCISVEGYWAILERLKKLQPVTRQTGKWILLDECANSGYYCSNCQKKLVKEGWSQTVKKIKFCPNCGARMESEEISDRNMKMWEELFKAESEEG